MKDITEKPEPLSLLLARSEDKARRAERRRRLKLREKALEKARGALAGR